MQENIFSMYGISGGYSFYNITWSCEIDKVYNLIEGYSSLAIYDELSWEIIQGIQLIGKYDYYDPQIELQSGSISRYSIGFEVYPLNIMEIKIQVRLNEINNRKKIPPEYLVQTHFWF